MEKEQMSRRRNNVNNAANESNPLKVDNGRAKKEWGKSDKVRQRPVLKRLESGNLGSYETRGQGGCHINWAVHRAKKHHRKCCRRLEGEATAHKTECRPGENCTRGKMGKKTAQQRKLRVPLGRGQRKKRGGRGAKKWWGGASEDDWTRSGGRSTKQVGGKKKKQEHPAKHCLWGGGKKTSQGFLLIGGKDGGTDGSVRRKEKGRVGAPLYQRGRRRVGVQHRGVKRKRRKKAAHS